MLIHFSVTTETVRGMVGDHCPRCETLRVFDFVDEEVVTLLFFIPVHKRLDASTVRCRGCQLHIPVRGQPYARIIPALTVPLDDQGKLLQLVEKTNPGLLERYQLQARVQARLLPVPTWEQNRIDPYLTALKQEACCDPQALELLKRFDAFSSLADVDRRELIDAAIKCKREAGADQVAYHFLVDQAASAPDWLHWLPIGLLTPGCIVGVGSLADMGFLAASRTVFFAAFWLTPILGFAVRRWRTWRYAERMVEAAVVSGVDLDRVERQIRGLRSTGPLLSASLRVFADRKRLWCAALATVRRRRGLGARILD